MTSKTDTPAACSAPDSATATCTRSQDQTGHLRALGLRTPYPHAGPGPHILETFPNNFPGRPYIVSIVFPEFTSLCPVTGQPDFATIVTEYIPDRLCVESKSFKLYMFAYRNHQSFMETITNTVLDHVVETLDPLWCRVKGLFTPRGGTRLHVFAERFKLADTQHTAMARETVAEWKRENGRHTA